jgi:hypothetical protein
MEPSPDFPPPFLRVATTLAFLGAFIAFVVQGRPPEDEAVLGLLTIASLARLQDLEEVSFWKFRMTFGRRMPGEWRELRPPSRAEELEESTDERRDDIAVAENDVADGDAGG